jgi:hypothetical protein
VGDAQGKGEAKKKERCKVGEGDDVVVVIEDSSDDEDKETLQERFQLRSRFSRAGMPNIPVIIEIFSCWDLAGVLRGHGCVCRLPGCD